MGHSVDVVRSTGDLLGKQLDRGTGRVRKAVKNTVYMGGVRKKGLDTQLSPTVYCLQVGI